MSINRGADKEGVVELAWSLSGRECACRCRRCAFSLQSGQISRAERELSTYASTVEPVPWSLGAASAKACTPEILRSEAREAAATRSPPTSTKSGPYSPQPEKSLSSDQDPAQASK